MQFEDILEKIGSENRFQKWLIVLLLLPTSFFNVFLEPLFMMSSPDHWCRVPELEHLNYSEQHRLIRPMNEKEQKPHTCFRYDVDLSKIEDLGRFNPSEGNFSLISCTDGWIYDNSVYSETAVTWYDYVCDRDYYKNLILSLTCVGIAIFTPLLSHLSDRIGRRQTMLLTFVIGSLSCISPLITKNVIVFVVCRIVASGLLNVYYQLPFVMTQEFVSQRYRTISSCLSAIFYSLGCCAVPFIANLTGSWVNYTWFIFMFSNVFILGYKWIPESPQWLVSNKRYDEAYDQLARVAQNNRKKVPDNLMEMLKSIKVDENEGGPNEDSLTDLLFRPGLRTKTLIITLLFVACIIGYGGIMANTVNMEAKEQQYNFFLLSFVDIPSLFLCWWLVNTPFGRRWTNVGSLGLCGLALMLPSVVPTEDKLFNTVCTLVAKFGVAGTFMVIYQHASELYPTTLRNQGIGISGTVGSIAAILVPQIVYLNKFGAWIPLFLMGIICTLGALLGTLLPETLHEYLPQRACDAAVFGQDQPFFSLARKKDPANTNDNDESKSNFEMKQQQSGDEEKNVERNGSLN